MEKEKETVIDRMKGGIESVIAKIRNLPYMTLLLVYILVLFPFLSMTGLRNTLGIFHSVYQAMAVAVLGILVLVKIRIQDINLFSVLFAVYQAIVLLSTVLTFGFSMGVFCSICASIFVILLIQKDTGIMIKALVFLGIGIMVLNFLSMLVKGSGSDTLYFIGSKNGFSAFLVPAAFLFAADSLIQQGRITRSVVEYIAAAFFVIFWGDSAAGLITAFAMVASFLYIRKFKPKVGLFVIIIAVCNILLVFGIEILTQTTLWAKLMEALGKDPSLTSRMTIWQEVSAMVWKKPILGLGRGLVLNFPDRWGNMKEVYEAHNFVLEILLEGGILGLLAYGVLFWKAVSKMDMNSMLHRLIFMAILVMLINSLVESLNNLLMLNVLLALAYLCSSGQLFEKKYGQQI